MKNNKIKFKKGFFFSKSLFLYGLGAALFMVFVAFIGVLIINTVIFSNKINQIMFDIERTKNIIPLLQHVSERGQENGYIPIGEDGIISNEFIPVFNVTNILNGGCWDASQNIPKLTSGIGINGLYFVVCTSGSIMLEGIDKWKKNDQLIFNGISNKWIRIDSSKNEINGGFDSIPNITANFMTDTTGPNYSVKSISVSTENILTSDNSISLIDDNINGIINISIRANYALDPIFSGFSSEDANNEQGIFAKSLSTQLSQNPEQPKIIRSLSASGDTILTDTPNGIEISLNPLKEANEPFFFGYQEVGIEFFEGTGPPKIRVIYQYGGGFLVVSSVRDIIGFDLPLFRPETGTGELEFALDYTFNSLIGRPDLFQLAFFLSPGKTSGQVTGRSNLDDQSRVDRYLIVGSCKQTSNIPPFTITCRAATELTGLGNPFVPGMIGFTIFSKLD